MPCDYKKYPADWRTVIRPRILARAENKCEQCRVPNGAWVCRGMWGGVVCWQDDDGNIYSAENGNPMGESYVGDVWGEQDKGLVKIVLTVAHLDHNTENNADGNLKALCQKCHLNHDKEFHQNNSRATRNKNRGLQNLF